MREAIQIHVELPDEGIDLPELLKALEGSLIDQAMARAYGDREEAAKLLGLKHGALRSKLRAQELVASKQRFMV